MVRYSFFHSSSLTQAKSNMIQIEIYRQDNTVLKSDFNCLIHFDLFSFLFELNELTPIWARQIERIFRIAL